MDRLSGISSRDGPADANSINNLLLPYSAYTRAMAVRITDNIDPVRNYYIKNLAV